MSVHVINDIYHIIEEGNIMGYQNKSVVIFLKISRKPYDMLSVEIIRRLVKKKDVRLLQ